MSTWKIYLCSGAIHLAVLLVGQFVVTSQAQFGMEAGQASLEVDLVAAPAEQQPVANVTPPPVETPVQPVPEPAKVEPPKPEPQVEPQPDDMARPQPIEESKPVVQPAPVVAQPRQIEIKEKGDGSSPKPGHDSTTLHAKGGAITLAKPDYLRNPAPAYPESSRRAKEQGRVMLKVQVSSRGTVNAVEVSESSGYRALDEAALKAVRKWKFKPAQMGPMPVESEVEVPVRFQLEQ